MYMYLGDKTIEEIIQFFATRPWKCFDLSGNNFNEFTSADLATIFSALPTTVTKFDLRYNYLNKEQLDAIINALPLQVESIIMDEEVIKLDAFLAKQLWGDVIGVIFKQTIARFAFDSIDPPIEIDANRLNRFIKILEKHNHPIADLTCGLLLEGQIKTTIDISENCNPYDEYMEKRTHDAISFYTKAANDSEIKPSIEFILWEMKTTCLIPSVQKRLAQYDVTPQGAYINESFNQASKNRLGVVTPLLANLGVFRLSPEPESTDVRITTKHTL